MSGYSTLFAILASAPLFGAFNLTSPAIPPTGLYPVEFTCDGASASPPLAWSNAPAGTRSFALTMHHIPGPGAEPHVYLVVYNLPPTVTSLAKNAHDVGAWGVNTVNRRPEYTPPCSKGPGAKTYTLTAYALSAEPDLKLPSSRVTMEMLQEAIQGKILATATLDVTFARTGAGGGAAGGGGGPRPPQEIERALSSLDLPAAQKQKVQALVEQYGEKQRKLREDLLSQLKATLTPDQYVKVEESLRQPPPRPR